MYLVQIHANVGTSAAGIMVLNCLHSGGHWI